MHNPGAHARHWRPWGCIREERRHNERNATATPVQRNEHLGLRRKGWGKREKDRRGECIETISSNKAKARA
jgi:hypothetical protein